MHWWTGVPSPENPTMTQISTIYTIYKSNRTPYVAMQNNKWFVLFLITAQYNDKINRYIHSLEMQKRSPSMAVQSLE